MRNALLAAAALAGLAAPAAAAGITGAGATFPYPIYARWAETYKAETGIAVNYQSIGSGGGIQQIKANTVTFGASDQPLRKDELDAAGLVQFPTVLGGIVPIVNLAGIAPGAVVFDGPTLAAIYMGTIKRWRDPAIAALNPGLPLPDAAIAVVHRSDGSGTTFNFTDYLSKVSSGWELEIGADAAVEWPVGIGAKGNEGVANTVRQTAGAIGYVEFAYAKENGLAHARMKNAAGAVVEPEIEALAAAAANADWASAPGYHLILTNQPGAASWPITAATFIIVHREPSDPAAVAEALRFFDWAYDNGDAAAIALDYVPIPDAVADMVRKTWEAEIRSGGNPVHSSM